MTWFRPGRTTELKQCESTFSLSETHALAPGVKDRFTNWRLEPAGLQARAVDFNESLLMRVDGTAYSATSRLEAKTRVNTRCLEPAFAYDTNGDVLSRQVTPARKTELAAPLFTYRTTNRHLLWCQGAETSTYAPIQISAIDQLTTLHFHTGYVLCSKSRRCYLS